MAGYQMQRARITIILLVIFLLFAVASLSFLAYTYSFPVEINTVPGVYAYSHQETYSCVAFLKENMIYDNQTTMQLSNVSIYRRVTDHIDVNFSYTFQGNLTTNITIGYSLVEFIDTPNWEKVIYERPQTTINSMGTNLSFAIDDIPSIYPDEIQNYVSKVSDETGVFASQYGLNITTEIDILAVTPDPFNETRMLTVNEVRLQTLSLEFKSSSADGDTITLKNLENNQQGEIPSEQRIIQSWVSDQRNIGFTLVGISLIGTGATTWCYRKTRPPKPKEPPKADKLLQSLIGPFEEIIVEAAPQTAEGEKASRASTTIRVETLEDLVKIADILDKPIVHTYTPEETHTFYALDGPTQYEFTTTISEMISKKAAKERKEEEEEEENE